MDFTAIESSRCMSRARRRYFSRSPKVEKESRGTGQLESGIVLRLGSFLLASYVARNVIWQVPLEATL